MGIPKALQAQVEEAERIQQQVYGQPAPKAEDQPSPEETAQQPTETVAAAPPEPKEPEATTSEQSDKDRKKKPFERDDVEAWKARYFSFQGNHRQMVSQLQAQIDDLKAQLEKKPEPEPKPQATTPQKRVTEKDVEAFGSDLIDVIHRKAQEVAEEMFSERQSRYEQEISSLKSELKEAKDKLGNVEQTQAQTVQERFFSTLEDRVPGWEEIQATDECQAWLGTKIPGTMFTWDAVLKDAAGNGDAVRAIEVFKQFFDIHPELDPNKKTSARQKANSELQRQVAPPKSAAAPSTRSNGKPIYTSADFEAESNRIIRLSKMGKYDEAARIEAELNAAMAEGRVRP